MTQPLANNVKVISINQPFLPVLAQYLNQKFKDCLPDLSRILLVFPSQRNKFYFRRYLLEESGLRGFVPPVMKTVDEFIDIIFEKLGGQKGILLNRVERNFVLKQVVDSLKLKNELWQDLPFLRFISIGDRLLKFFDELAKERVTLDAIEKITAAGHFPERYVENELPILRLIYERYRGNLKSLGWQDEVDKYDAVYNQFDAQLLKEYSNIIIAGLVATTTVENRIIAELLSQLSAELILHSGTPTELIEMKDTDQPFYLHYKLLKAIGAKPAAVEEIRVRETARPVSHIKAVRSEAQENLHLLDVIKGIRDRYEPHRVAVVLPDESIVHTVVEMMKVSGLEFNVSIGRQFSLTILYSFLNQLKTTLESNCHYKDFFALIKHPLVKNATITLHVLRPIVYDLEKFIIKQKINYYDAAKFKNVDFEPLIELIERCFKVVRAPLPFSEYIEELTKLLNIVLSYNGDLMKTHAVEIKEFVDRLNDLAQLRIPAGTVEPGIKMLEFILWVLGDDRYHLHGDPMRGIQIIGLLEARNLDFDCLIVPSMNEGIFPMRSEKDLFINNQARQLVGLPYDKERDNLYLYYFNEVKGSNKELFVSYVDEEARDVRSRFIDFLIGEGARFDDTEIPLDRVAVAITDREVKKDQRLLRFLYSKIQQVGLTQADLKYYRKCPYCFYLNYLLGIKEPDEIVEEPGALEWGTAIHHALENFYRYDFAAGFTDKKLDQAKTKLAARLENEISKTLAEKPSRVTFIDQKVYQRRLARFLESELERFEQGYKVSREDIEKRVVHEIKVGGKIVCLKGYIDRVDVFERKYYIIDYKTGVKPRKKDYEIGDNFIEFQLPLYAYSFCKGDYGMIGGLLYYSIRREIEIVDIVERSAVAEYLTLFKDRILMPTLEEMIDPTRSFYQKPARDNCRNCSYGKMCGAKYG